MLFDLPLEQLQAYCPPRDEPADFDAFWAKTLAEARDFPLGADFAPVDAGLRLVDTFDVTYRLSPDGLWQSIHVTNDSDSNMPVALTDTPATTTITLSNKVALRCSRSKCPSVSGSNVPG